MIKFDDRPTETTKLTPLIGNQYFLPRNVVNSIELDLNDFSDIECSVQGPDWELLKANNIIPFHIENLAPSLNMQIMFWISHWENGPPIGDITMLQSNTNKFTFSHLPNGRIWINMWYAGNTAGKWFDGQIISTGITSDRWRILITSTGLGGEPAISEIEMRDAVSGNDQCVGGVATQSSYIPNNSTTTFLGINCFDDSNITYWESSPVDITFGGSWVEYNFGVAIPVLEVTIRSRIGQNSNQAPQDFEVQYYDYITLSWISVLTVTGEPAWVSNEKRIYPI